MKLLLTSAASTLLSSLIFYLLYSREKAKKLEKIKSEITTNYQALLQEKDRIIKEFYIKQMEVIKKILLSCIFHERERFRLRRKEKTENVNYKEDMNSIYPQLKILFFGHYTFQFEWEKFYCLLDELHDCALSKLYKKHSKLTPDQFKFCSLLLANFTTKETAYILDIKTSSIRMRKMLIREILGISNGGDIAPFIVDFSSKEPDIEEKDKLKKGCELFEKLNRISWNKSCQEYFGFD